MLRGWDRLKSVGAPTEESKILILGGGIIGNLWTCFLHHNGLRDVVVSEPSEFRRKIGSRLGTGFKIVSPAELSKIMPATRAEAEQSGIDVIIDCTGVPQALERAIPFTKRGAKILIFGCAPMGAEMKICPEEIFAKELTILGTMINPYTYDRAVALAQNMGSKYLDMEKLGELNLEILLF